MISRQLFSSKHDQFREAVRRFVDREVVPLHERWEEAGKVDRDLWLKAGEAGMLCPSLPEAYGGYGAAYLFNVLITEELVLSASPSLPRAAISKVFAAGRCAREMITSKMARRCTSPTPTLRFDRARLQH